MVEQFPFDYMNVVCIGVVKTLLVAWTKVRGCSFSLSRSQITEINSKLLLLRKCIPSEFCRKPRSLDDLDRFKAFLKSVLDESRYNNSFT